MQFSLYNVSRNRPSSTRPHRHYFLLTFQHDFPKNRRIPTGSATVPAVIVELVLALLDSHLGPSDHGDHDIRVGATQAALTAEQTRDVVTDDPSAHQRQRVHRQLA